MKPSEKCKRAGLKSLVQLSEISNASTATLRNWSRANPKLFNAVLIGSVRIMKNKQSLGG